MIRPGASPPPVAILAVDDHPENLVSLRAILRGEDVRLVTVSSGEEALGRLLREDFALVLLDVVMPGMDGFEVARHMKQLERTARIPIIFLTAVARDVQQIYRAYSVGAVDYLVKPLEPHVVKMKVAVFVDLYRQRLEIQENERRERELRLHEQRLASDTRYRKLVEGIGSAVAWTLDLDTGSLSFVSRQAERVFGLTPEALSARDFWERHIHPDDRDRFAACLRSVRREGVDQAVDHRLVTSAGRHLWFHTGMSALADPERRSHEIHGISLETTDLKRAEETQRLMADMPSLVGEPFDLKTALTRLARLVVPQLADWCMVDAVANDAVARVAVAYVEPGASGPPRTLEPRSASGEPPAAVERVRRTGSSELHEDLSAPGPLADALGALEPDHLLRLGAVSCMIVPLRTRRDTLAVLSLVSSTSGRRFAAPDLAVAEQLARRAALQIDNATLLVEARDAVRAREDVLGVVSHDLRGPLSVILLGTDVIGRICSSEEALPQAKKMSLKIRRAAVRMDRLIGDLLDGVRIDGHRLELDLERHDVAALIADSLELLESIADEKSIALDASTDAAKDAAVLCDRERVRRVFFNIVGNAVKFSPEGSRIAIAAKRTDGSVLFSIADRGPGIGPEELPHIFERYWQGRDKARRGVGLGLSIAKGIVEAHGGQLWAESVVGAGTTFSFTLPLARSDAAGEGARASAA